MQINSENSAPDVKIRRLEAEQAALQARLSKLEPPAKAPKIDHKTLKAEEAARQKSVAALKEKLTAWKTQSAAIDKLLADLVGMIKAERETRAGITTAHRELIEKETRRALANDQAIVSGLQGMIGDTLRPRTDQQEDSLAELADRYSTMIMQRLETSDVDDLLA